MTVAAPTSEEHVRNLAGHVERGEQRAEYEQIEWRFGQAPAVGGLENAILAPEAGKE